METFLIRALQLVFALSILVFIHELGHFLFARVFKVRVEKFYLFFDWGFSLFKFKPKHSETEYGIGWLPLGGYCKIAGMIDESLDTEQMKKEPQPWEFRSKPAWQRLLIMVGGVLFNFILALFIYAMVLFTWGDSYMNVQKASYGMVFNENAKSLGFEDGDVILRTNKKELTRYGMDLYRDIVDADRVTVLRGGKETIVNIPKDFGLLDLGKKTPFMQFLIPPVLDSVAPGKPAQMAGLQQGDTIKSVAGQPIRSWRQLTALLDTLHSRAGAITTPDTIMVVAARAGGVVDTMAVACDSTFKLGIMPYTLDHYYTMETETYNFFTAFPAGVGYGVKILKGYVSDFKYVFTKEGAQSVGMFGAIGSLFPPLWDWHQFWLMTAFLSIILAFMNILPIPALDGGHVLFLLVEVVTRRKPSDKFLERAQIVGMVIILGLFLLATYNDIMRFLF